MPGTVTSPEMTDRAVTDELLDGSAHFTADLHADGALVLTFVTSPVARARIVHLDTTPAAIQPGVVAVFTASDLPTEPIHEIALVPEEFAQPALADGEVRYVGEYVAAVVAESAAVAEDAVELVDVEYDALPSVNDPREAHEVALAWDAPAAADAFAAAELTVRASLTIPRVAVAPMEGRAILAVPEPDGRLTVYASTQAPHWSRVQLARSLGLPPDFLRVVTPHVGGAFGGKAVGGVAPYVVACRGRAASRPSRALRGATRSQPRDDAGARALPPDCTPRAAQRHDRRARDRGAAATRARIPAPDRSSRGRRSSWRAGRTGSRRWGSGRGAYARTAPVRAPTAGRGARRRPRRSSARSTCSRASSSSTPPRCGAATSSPRPSCPRPPPAARTTTTETSPRSSRSSSTAQSIARWREEQRTRRAASAVRVLGIGLATVLDSTAWFERQETACVRVLADGRVRVFAGTASAGQLHARAYAAIVVARPCRSSSTRSRWSKATPTSWRAARARRARARCNSRAARSAARPSMCSSRPGSAPPTSSKRPSTTWWSMAAPSSCVVPRLAASPSPSSPLATPDPPSTRAACSTRRTPPTRVLPTSRSWRSTWKPVRSPCSGTSRPRIAAGSWTRRPPRARSWARARRASRRPSSKSCSTTTAATRSAPASPTISYPPHPTSRRSRPGSTTTETSRNPLGARGVGEVGMVAAPAAVHGAVLDAVAYLGVRHIDMPCTPERVWRAVRAARDR